MPYSRFTITVAGVIDGTAICNYERSFAEVLGEEAKRRQWLDDQIIFGGDRHARSWSCPSENDIITADLFDQDKYLKQRIRELKLDPTQFRSGEPIFRSQLKYKEPRRRT